ALTSRTSWRGCPGRRLLDLARSGRGPENVGPERSADSEAALVVLEVMAHVQLAQPSSERRRRAVMVHVVMEHVVGQVPGEESRPERQECRAAEHDVEPEDEQRCQ